jgi:hypothetical protein
MGITNSLNAWYCSYQSRLSSHVMSGMTFKEETQSIPDENLSHCHFVPHKSRMNASGVQKSTRNSWWRVWQWLLVLRGSPVCILPPMLHTHVSFVYQRYYMKLAVESVFEWNSELWQCWTLTYGTVCPFCMGVYLGLLPYGKNMGWSF